MIYPKIFKMKELIELSVEELGNLEAALYTDWTRVRHALEVVRELKGEE